MVARTGKFLLVAAIGLFTGTAAQATTDLKCVLNGSSEEVLIAVSRDPRISGGLAASTIVGGRYAIFVAPAFLQLPDNLQGMILGHECGHIVLGHLDRRPNASTMSEAIRGNWQREFDADCFAAQSLRRLGRLDNVVLAKFSYLMAQTRDSASHPGGDIRLQALQQCVNRL